MHILKAVTNVIFHAEVDIETQSLITFLCEKCGYRRLRRHGYYLRLYLESSIPTYKSELSIFAHCHYVNRENEFIDGTLNLQNAESD